MGSESSKFLPDAIHGSPLSHVTSSRDERTQLTDSTSIPYCWTCRLVIETLQGKKYTSNGFKLNLGSTLIDKQVILTTGHSIYIEGGYARNITIITPTTEKPIIATKEQFWASPEYINNCNPKYNYGFILLPMAAGKSNEGFGWTTLLTNQELIGRPLSMCGYPSDDPNGALWVTAGGVESVTNHHITFMQDSLGTGSGSPVYTCYKGYWTVVGIQGFGGIFNTVIRLTPSVICNLLQAINYPISYTIQPFSLPNVCLQIDPITIREAITTTTVTITCNHIEGTQFNVIPLQCEPSSANKNSTNTSSITIKGLYLYELLATNGENSLLCTSSGSTNDVLLDSLYLIHENNDESVSFESFVSSAERMFLSISDEEDSVLIKQIFVSKKSKLGPKEKFVLTAKPNKKTA